MNYSFDMWLFCFYFYCFLGWVWETCYVSVLQAKWVNRGFMHGPFLPIYGSGAIVVLLFTLQYRTNAVAVFFVGMISATLLEYFTGVAMEKLFHVRYWDYSNQPFNLKGHICLLSSLAWGVFSVILTLYGHNPVERLVMSMNNNLLEVLVFGLTVYISIDMAFSVRDALNLKEMLLSLEKNNEDFRRIQKHIEVVSAFYGGELKEKSEAGLKKINLALNSGREMYEKLGEGGKKLKEGIGKKKKSLTYAEFERRFEEFKASRSDSYKSFGELIDGLDKRTSELNVEDEKQRESILSKIAESRSLINTHKSNDFAIKNKDADKLRRLLSRNPKAVSSMHEQAFSQIKKLTEEDDEA